MRTKPRVYTACPSEFKQCQIFTFLQVKRVSKDPGPPGPRGYNGTNGRPGRPGFNNLTLCSYQTETSTGQSPDTYASQVMEKTEPNVGYKIHETTLCNYGKLKKIVIIIILLYY